MAVKERVVKVWIEPGCIVCDACETACPEVFDVQETTCVIRPEALNAEFTKPLTPSIVEAAEECPVDVIKFETVEEEVAESAPAEAAAPPAAAAAPAAEPVSAAAPAAPAAHTPKAAPVPAAAAVAASAAPRDEALQGLLESAKARGGRATLQKVDPGELALRDLQNKKFDELPVDGKFYKTLDAARKRSAGGASRREVLTASGAAMVVGWTAMGVAGAGGMLPMFQRFMMPNALEEPDPRVRVGSLKKYRDMAPGDVNEDFKPQGIWLIRLEDRISALNIICTHLGCIPNWLPNDRKFLCPCHGSGYYQTGINFQGPTPRPLERFRIFEVDGTVVVDKSRKFQYELGQWDNPDSFIAV